MRYKHIVFDIDGTLIDTEYAVLHSLQETVKTLSGKELPLSDLAFALGITGADALDILGIKDISPAIDLWNQNMCHYADTVTVFDQITDLLERLSKLGCEMGIVTSKTKEEFEQDFCPMGISHYFKIAVCADDTAEHKPDAAPLLKYMEYAGISGEELLYVGDSKYDGLCAKNAGVDFALAVWGSHSCSIPADHYLNDPVDLLSIINIKNIVFDFGNVIIKWDVNALLEKYDLEEDTSKILKETIFASEEWLQMDSGLLSAEQAEKIFQAKVPDPLKNRVSEIMRTWFENVEFNKEICALIQKLKQNGYRIYGLSNTNIPFYEYIKNSDIGVYFDGFVISAVERMMKPDRQIFERFFEKFSLDPGECFLIDDTEENISAAAECGMRGFVFDMDHFQELERKLMAGY